MAINFYNRYIPPRTRHLDESKDIQEVRPEKKRKRVNDAGDLQKRQKVSRGFQQQNGEKSKRKDKDAIHDLDAPESADHLHGASHGKHDVYELPVGMQGNSQVGGEMRKSTSAISDQSGPRVANEAARDQVSESKNHHSAGEKTQAQDTDRPTHRVGSSDRTRKKPKREKAVKEPEKDESVADSRDIQSEKYSRIKQKYSKHARDPPPKSGGEAKQDGETQQQPEEQQPKLHGFGPIPKPAADASYKGSASIFSALPTWLREPKMVPSSAALPFKTLPIAPALLKSLQNAGFGTSLPVQAGVLPSLLPTNEEHLGDVCISAATGSGKTLSYVLPILQDLESATPSRLRALIVVPTRELVDQVLSTFNLLDESGSIRVATASGSHSLDTEQLTLIDNRQRYEPEGWKRYQAFLDAPAYDSDIDSISSTPDLVLEDAFDLSDGHVPCFESKIDVLITTPGRLVEHIRQTRGFTLSHLRWLIIDEADRLLDQSFQEWADTVDNALRKPRENSLSMSGGQDLPLHQAPISQPNLRKVVCSASMTRDLEKLGSLRLKNPMSIVVEGGSKPKPATDEDAEVDDIQTTATGAMVLPNGLEEYAIPVGNGSEKPLYLLKLLEMLFAGEHVPGTLHKKLTPNKYDHSGPSDSDTSSTSSSESDSDVSQASSNSSKSPTHVNNHSPSSQLKSTPPSAQTQPLILIFTSTSSSATRLASLLRYLAPPLHNQTTTLTKSTAPSKTRKLLASFATPSLEHNAQMRGGNKRIIIATDRASRGLDIPRLTDVISYDVPRSQTAYVHRVGRTARAGREGKSWTLLQGREAGWFWHNVAENPKTAPLHKDSGERIERAVGQKVRKVRLEDVKTQERVKRYEAALEKLKGEVGEYR
ncbi:MAG: hypothetical protein Q9162_006205 [Coniocarpon cinnabarinum]